MSKIFLETKQLVIYQPTYSDIFEWETLFNNTQIMQYAQHGWSDPQIELELSITSWDQHGYGIGLVIHKETQQTVGISGLYQINETGEIATVTLLEPQYWHHHYSSELKQAHIAWAFTHLDVEYLLAVIQPENSASRAVLERAGMHFYKSDYYYNSNDKLSYYIITRSELEKVSRDAKAKV